MRALSRKWGRMIIAAAFFPASAMAQERDITVEEFLQSLSTVPNVISRKDPFISAKPPFRETNNGSGVISRSAPVLERYPVEQYTVVATLLGDQYPRALVRLPASESGKVLIVKQRDKLGNKNGMVSRILKDSLVVSQNYKSPLGFVEKMEITLEVGKEAPKATTPADDVD